MRHLLDTNVLSELVKPAPDAAVVAWVSGQPPLGLATSVLTLGELVRGIHGLPAGPRRETLEQWVTHELPRQFVGRLLGIDQAVASAWGHLSAEAKRVGRELPVIDALLLATARVHGLTLVTRNERDCAGRGVPILNPWL